MKKYYFVHYVYFLYLNIYTVIFLEKYYYSKKCTLYTSVHMHNIPSLNIYFIPRFSFKI